MIGRGGSCLVRAALIGLVASALACVARLAPPEVEVEQTNLLSDELAGEGLDAMREYAAHLRAVSDPLRLRGTDLCRDEIVPYLGVILEIIGQGLPTPLDRVRRLRGIEVSPTVVRVIEDSPAAHAELQPNDVILSFNGSRLLRYRDFHDRLKRDRNEAPRLEIERAGKRHQVSLPYRPACTPPVVFSSGGALLPWHGPRHGDPVVVARGLMDFVRNDDQLAILVAHEMAHLIIDHPRPTPETEVQADRLAFELALRAGYDIGGAVEIWQRLAVEHPHIITSHPETKMAYHGHVAARTLLMQEIIAELESR